MHDISMLRVVMAMHQSKHPTAKCHIFLYLTSQLLPERISCSGYQMDSMDNEHHSTMLSRLDRLDIMMGYLEEIKTSKAMGNSFASTTTTSSATGTTTTTTTSEGALGNSSVNSSPKSITDVVTEAQMKGSLLDRVSHLEKRVMKLSLQVEKENKEEKSLRCNKENKKQKKGLKHLVKSCVKGGGDVIMTKD